MTRHSFRTMAEATDAGYRRVNHATDRDVSAEGHPGGFGYAFEDADGARTVDVWLAEATNRIGQTGAVCPMFPSKICGG